mgnify:CR=1 FL=1
MSLQKIKLKNNNHNIFKYDSNHTLTPNKKLFTKDCEEVYKLNFSNINTKIRENELISKFKIAQSIETPELFNSIDRVKQFLPDVANLISISRSKKIESMLFKRFEHQEFEKVVKKEIKTITEKRDELKNKIIKKREELQKLEDKISDMQFSIKTYSDMNKSYLRSESKKKVFNRFSIKELSTPQFAPFLNKNNMSNKNLTDNNIQKEVNLNPIKKFNSFLKLNTFNKDIVQRNSVIDNNKIADNIEDDKETKEKNLSYERMLYQKGQEIIQLKKVLPQIKSHRNKLSLEIQNLEHEKTMLKNKKDNLTEHLYLYFLEILKEGKDTRNEGLSWIIKEIFQLNKKVLISYIPQYLDNHAIAYIFKQARLNLLLEDCENQVKKIKNELVNLNLVKKANKNKLRIVNKKLFYKENDKNKEDNYDLQNNNEYKNKLKKNLTEISLDIKLVNNNNAQINNYSSRANIFNDYSKLSNTTRTDFTNINNDSYYNKTESTYDNNYADKINFITNTNNNESKKNEILVCINDNNITNNNEKLQRNEITDINNFRGNNHNFSTSKISLKKILSNSMDTNLRNNTFNFNNSKNSKKIKISHKLLDLYHKKVDLNDINTIPEKLKLAEVNNYLGSKISKINEKNSGKIEQYFENNQKIKNIKKKIKELRDNEMKRIFEEYLKKGYHKKYMVEKEILLSALIGEDNVLPELNKQMKESRLYFESLKKCGLMNQSFNVNQQINLLNTLFLEQSNASKNIDE